MIKNNIHYILCLVFLLLCLPLVAPVAAGEYSYILEQPDKPTDQKLAEFTAALGWQDEYATYQMVMVEYEMQVAAKEAEAEAARVQANELARTFGLETTALTNAAKTAETEELTPPYTEEEIAALDAASAAYYEAYAANYVATAAYTGSGSGTQSDPYIITNRAELEAIANDLSAHYALANDIDLGGSSDPWDTPIGSFAAPFTGNLDGRGHILKNMYFHGTYNGGSYGFFNTIAGATIINIAFDNVDIDIVQNTYFVIINGNRYSSCGILSAFCISNTYIDSIWIRGTIHAKTTAPDCNYVTTVFGSIDTNVYNTRGVSVSNIWTDIDAYNVATRYGGYSGLLSGNTAGDVTITNVYCMGSSTTDTVYGLNNGGISSAGTSTTSATGNLISNSVALLDSLTQNPAGTPYRVVRSDSYTMPKSNNYASSNMLVNGNTVSGGTTTNGNGADVSPETYHTQSFWQNTLGWDFTNIWYWDDTEQLPKLRVFLHGPTGVTATAAPTTGGITTQITLTGTATDATSYQWQYSTNSGSTYTDITGATSLTGAWTPGASGTYLVRLAATNADGITYSDPVTVTIYDVPVVSAAVSPTAGPVQQTLTLSGTVTDPGPGTTTYQWQQSADGTTAWTNIAGATTATYQYAFTGSAGTTHYRLAATGTGGTAYSNTVTYTAYDAPTVTAAIDPQTGPLSQSLTLSGTVTDPGSGETTYQWQQYTADAWADITGAITNPYTYAFTGTAGTHQFRLAATGTGGTAYSDPVTYTAVAPPVITATVTPATGNYPLTVTYTASATDATAYQWQMFANSGSTWTDISTTPTGTYTHQTAGTYQWRVTATGIGGTTTSDPITITVTTPPPVFSSVSISPTAGALDQQFTLSAAASDTTAYQWQSAAAGSTAWTNIATGATATYTYPDGTADGTYQIRVVATGPGGSTASDPVSIILSDLAPGITSVSVTPATGDVPLTISMAVTAINNPTYQWQISANSGSTWTNIATGATASYTIPDVGTYQIRVVATNEYGSATSDVRTVVATPPVPVITSASVSPSAGAVPLTVVLSAAATNNPAYQWDLLQGSTWVPIATGATGSYTFGTNVPTGQYDIRVTASNSYGFDTEILPVSIVGMPTVQIVYPGDGSEHAAGRSVTFSAQGTGSTYEWTFGDGATATGQTVQHTYQNLGRYTARVTAINAAGSASDTVQLTVVEAADILLTVSDISSRGALLTAEIEQTPVPAGTGGWFEIYSPSGQLIWKTNNVTYSGNTASFRADGMPLLSGQSYTARAFADGYAPSLRQPVQLLNATAAPYETMGVQWAAGLNREPFNISSYLILGPSVFGNVMGGGSLGVTIAVGVIMMFILVSLWLRQQDVTIPLILGLITSFSVLALVPAEFKAVGYTLMIISLVGLIWQLFKK